MKNASTYENWSGNMSIEIIFKQLKNEIWSQLRRAVAESVGLTTGHF